MLWSYILMLQFIIWATIDRHNILLQYCCFCIKRMIFNVNVKMCASIQAAKCLKGLMTSKRWEKDEKRREERRGEERRIYYIYFMLFIFSKSYYLYNLHALERMLSYEIIWHIYGNFSVNTLIIIINNNNCLYFYCLR